MEKRFHRNQQKLLTTKENMKKFIWASVAVWAILVAACSGNEMGDNEQSLNEKNASMTIRLSGTKSFTRAMGLPTVSSESALHNVGIYVFDVSGNLEKFAYFTDDLNQADLQKEITELTKGPKSVVVLANMGSENAYPATSATDTYTSLQDSKLNWTDLPGSKAELATMGLPMSGETTAVLQPGDANSIAITLTRLVAKVRLAKVTIEDAGSHVPVNLTKVAILNELSRVGVIKADAEEAPSMLHGLGTTVTDGLWNTISNSYEIPDSTSTSYFYLLPYHEAASKDNATIMSLVSEQENDSPKFFSFVINPVRDGVSADNAYLRRNSQYALSVTLKYHETGTETPGEINQDASVNVELSVEPWATEIGQDETWD